MKNYRTIFWKVVLGFAIAAGLLATTYYIAYDNLRGLQRNINALSEVSPKKVYRKKIEKKIDEIDFYVRKYSLNKNDSLPALFESCVNDVGRYMDELDSITADNDEYTAQLRKLGYYINLKLQLSRQRLLLSDGYNSDVELSGLMTQIEDYQTSIDREKKKEEITGTQSPLPQQPTTTTEEPKKKPNFFSKLFHSSRSKKKAKAQLPDRIHFVAEPVVHDINTPANPDTAAENNVITTEKLKDILQEAQIKENARTSRYFLEAITLIEKDAKVMDSMRATFSTMEKMEITESRETINGLTEDTTNRTCDILTNLIISGVLALLVFVVVVYREVRHNNKLRKELIKEKKSTEKLAKAKEEFLANMSHEIRTPMNRSEE